MHSLCILPKVLVHLVVYHNDQFHVAGVFIGVVGSTNQLTLVCLATCAVQHTLEFTAIQTMWQRRRLMLLLLLSLVLFLVVGVIILMPIVATGGVLLQQVCVPEKSTNKKEI